MGRPLRQHRVTQVDRRAQHTQRHQVTGHRVPDPAHPGYRTSPFLAKILLPGFFTRDRPDRASPRKPKKAGDFPARKPGEPSVVCVTRRIEFHLLYPG